MDAEAAAQAVVSGKATATPKSGDGPVEQIRVYKIAKDSAVKARRKAINQLQGILGDAEPELRESLAGLGKMALVTRCAKLGERSAAPNAVNAHVVGVGAPRQDASTRRSPTCPPGSPHWSSP